MKLVLVVFSCMLLHPNASFAQISDIADDEERSNAYFQMWVKRSDETLTHKEKMQIINNVVPAIIDSNAGTREWYSERLLSIDKTLLNNQSLQLIEEVFNNDALANYYTILLIGNLKLAKDKRRLYDFIKRDSSGQFNKSISYKSTEWAAHLALARMGGNENMDFILSHINEEPHISTVYFNLLDDLAYTGQKPAIDFVVEKLFSDEAYGYMPYEEPLREIKTPFALRTLPILAVLIEDIPLRKSEVYNMSDLRSTRAWFAKNEGKYELKEGVTYVPRL